MQVQSTPTKKVHFEFNVPMINKRHAVFNASSFNQEDETFYQKFKNHVPVFYHNQLKWLKDFDIKINQSDNGKFHFAAKISNESQAKDLATVMLHLVELVHNLPKKNVIVEIQQQAFCKKHEIIY